MKDKMLTTIENPFNPFKNFENWLKFDREKNHFTLELIDRFTLSRTSFTEEFDRMMYDWALEDIIESDFEGKYRIVNENSYFLEDNRT